jgi:predicted Rossmann fold flavoprotein
LNKFDVCVVGAGVSGIAAAITAASGGLSVLLIEKNKKIGAKIYATGNGKCNLTNVNIDEVGNYNSSDENYAAYLQALYKNGDGVHSRLYKFFKDIGLATYADANGYVYPCSNQASSVVWAMKDALDVPGVTTVTNAAVTDIRKSGNAFSVSYTLNSGESVTASARYVLLSCGGNSYARLGGSTRGYKLAEALGHHITDIYPALCGLKTDSTLHSADGVRVKTTARLLANDNIIYEAAGEVQITAYGLSGIAIFNLSSKALKHIKNGELVEIAMNLLENTAYSREINHNANSGKAELDELKKYLTAYGANRTILGALNGITNEKLANYALEMQGISPKERLGDISADRLKEVITGLTDYRCRVTASNDFDMAQVTAGGVRLSEIDMKSFESKLVPGLYITGEMLDIDGICGGYNITFALMSGITAAENIAIKKEKL